MFVQILEENIVYANENGTMWKIPCLFVATVEDQDVNTRIATLLTTPMDFFLNDKVAIESLLHGNLSHKMVSIMENIR